MTDEIGHQNTLNNPNSAMNQRWISDAKLDKIDKLVAEDQAEKYHTYLSEMSAEGHTGTSKDRMARMAEIVAKHHVVI